MTTFAIRKPDESHVEGIDEAATAPLTPTGIQGGLVHIANHAFAKITLFFCAGAIYVATHKKNISEMSGLGRAMPITFGAFSLAALSMMGAPPVVDPTPYRYERFLDLSR